MEQNTLNILQFLRKNISCITPFNGDIFGLAGFISRVDIIIPTMNSLEEQYKTVALGYIRDKVIGKAREDLFKQGSVSSWVELKQALIRNHGERTPVEDIIDELTLCRCESSIENFYNKITSILCKLNNAYILRDEFTQERSTRNHRLALKHFTQHLPFLAKNLVGWPEPRHFRRSLRPSEQIWVSFSYK